MPARAAPPVANLNPDHFERFVEDNWLGGTRLGAGSFDTITNPIDNMFDFERENPGNRDRFILDPSSGQPVGGNGW